MHVPRLRPLVLTVAKPIAQWLLRTQHSDGSWARTGSADQQRSPRVSSLLALLHVATRTQAAEDGAVERNKLVDALVRYVNFLAEHGRGEYGLEDILNTSGFVGLALLDLSLIHI